MNNLYVFAIGGSGERVMRSLIMLLTAGMSVGARTIKPVFVDNDEKSDALDKCKKLINYYRSEPGSTQNNQNVGLHSLYRGLSPIPSFAHVNIDEPVLLNISGTKIGNLRSIIGEIDKESKLEMAIAEERDLLFSKNDLDMPLNVGFVGNPNIGTVVLDSVSFNSDEFRGILGNVSSNDGVIVIGSLFGGTGAAGFPLVINKFNERGENQRPLLGGVTILPYYTLTEKDGTKNILDTEKYDVKCETFDAKTRAALMYYDDYMKKMDYCYYIGDDHRPQYSHYVGGEEQNNPVNLVEVFAAQSIIDFSKQTRPESINYKRPIWGFIDDRHSDSNINCIPSNDMRRSLVKFEMLKMLFINDCFLSKDIEDLKPHVHNIGFKDVYLKSIREESEIQNKNFPSSWGLCNMFEQWDLWLKDLKSPNAKRKLSLFNDGETVNPQNITSLFFSNSRFGIAKVETKREGFLKKQTTEIASDPQIAKCLIEAYQALYPKGKSGDANNIPEDQRLGKLLQILSVALDKVIDNYCVI